MRRIKVLTRGLKRKKRVKKDEMWKLRPCLEKLREQCLQVPPEEHHAVDDIMVPFKGKSHLKVCMTLMFVKGQQIQKRKSPILVLAEMLFWNWHLNWHEIFAGKYFTSLPLLEHLQETGIYYFDTIRINKVRDCQMMEEKDLMKQGRGSIDHRVNKNNVIFVRWCDNKAVTLVTCFVGNTPQGLVKCWEHKTNTYVMVPMTLHQGSLHQENIIPLLRTGKVDPGTSI